jgi:hypothetical protein
LKGAIVDRPTLIPYWDIDIILGGETGLTGGEITLVIDGRFWEIGGTTVNIDEFGW